MNCKDIGIGDFAVGRNSGELRTYALGSCVALVVWDAQEKVGGLVHVALPDSVINPQKAREQPGYFVDTGLDSLFAALKRRGAQQYSWWVKLVGGAAMFEVTESFDIGRRNTLAVKKYLSAKGVRLNAEDTGGSISRTVTLTLSSGELQISNSTGTWHL